MDRTGALERIKVLVEKYAELEKEGRIGKYNEEMTKKDFILPLFDALGWNTVDSREVSAEERVSKQRVDYGFRISGIPKFFLEAKSFKEDLDSRKFVDQAINYSWLKGCTWAVLTNFERVVVFNAELKTDHPWQSQLKRIHCREFSGRFDELWLLSRESLEQGVIDREAEKWSKKTRKSRVDKQLLTDFTRFRELLSKSITKLNQSKNLTEEELDESIQRILDRLIFIRNCEDKELEAKTLISNLREWEGRGRGQLVKSLREVFSYFDKAYNSKIFANHLCDGLEIENDVLHEIVEGLYHTADNSVFYDFSAIDADVLGTIYEQYLSHILKKTEKRATITENHIHKKEQGIYYTPIYIVDYIVRKALGELLEEKKVNIEKIKVLDPACGSGSFLIKAFDVLNEHYKQNDKDYSQTQLDLDTGTTFTRKVKILQDNIFGVDLDKQAVEIAQLNLLLKIAEKGHRLPLLERNIRCGNSLIDDEKLAGDKAFKWDEQFNEIMREGGFDVVIGNPPYVRQEELSEMKPYLETNYESYQGTADLFVYFFEKELKILKEDGYFGMIVSNKWLRAGYGKNLRKLLTGFWIEEFIDFGDLKVFPDATIYPCIMIMRKIRKPNPKIRICKMETLGFSSLGEYVRNNSFFIDQSELNENEWNIQKTEANELLKKIRSSGLPIEEYVGVRIYRGIVTGLNEAFEIDRKKRDELIGEDSRNEELIKPFLTGAEVKRYSIRSKNKYVIFTRRGIDILQYPSVLRYLEQFKKELSPKKSKEQEIGRKPGKYEWYEIQDSTAYYRDFEKPKIVWGNLAKRSSFSLDETNEFYVNNPANILPSNSRYVLGILNSKLMSYFLKSICAERQGGFIEQKPVYVSQVPVKKPTKEQEIEITRHVEKILQLNEKLLRIGDKLTDERARIEDEIKKTDSEIDELVYKIYGITEDERTTIEDSLK
jgi:type I restriction-modification system DNA methylase subunit